MKEITEHEQRQDPQCRVELRIFPYETAYKWEIRCYWSDTGVTTTISDGKKWADLTSTMHSARHGFDQFVHQGRWVDTRGTKVTPSER